MEQSLEDLDWKNIEPDPRLLLHCNIPKPLHEVNPRSIKGESWWNEQRFKVYEEQGNHCAACGVHKSQAEGKKQWLECHEIYEINWKKGRAFFIKLVALCPYCHKFIHSGRLQALYKKREIKKQEYLDIIKHGTDILEKEGLKQLWEERHDQCEDSPGWGKWRLVFEGNYYKPKFKSYKEWAKHYGYPTARNRAYDLVDTMTFRAMFSNGPWLDEDESFSEDMYGNNI